MTFDIIITAKRTIETGTIYDTPDFLEALAFPEVTEAFKAAFEFGFIVDSITNGIEDLILQVSKTIILVEDSALEALNSNETLGSTSAIKAAGWKIESICPLDLD